MKSILKGRSLLTLKDFSAEEIRFVLDLAKKVKAEAHAGKVRQRLRGKTIALIFEKRSTRTRCSFETAIGEEGGHPVFLTLNDIHLGAKEPIQDTARVLGRMFSAIEFRGYKQETVEALARISGIPVYNGLTDDWHPTQVLADLMTIEEAFGSLPGRKLAYLGDGRNNVANTLLVGCSRMGVHITVVAPPELRPAEDLVRWTAEECAKTGARAEFVSDVAAGVKSADVISTDAWGSMGEEDKSADRLRLLAPYRVTREVLALTGRKETLFMHDLPAVRGNEVAGDVLDGPSSRAWDQAENRKHTIKALLLATL
jgi:ornithine carbamoyltransferase